MLSFSKFVLQKHINRNFSTSLPVLLDSVTGKKKEVIQNHPYTSWYSCGPTVYDSSHVGHARTYVQIDIIQRLLDSQFGYNIYNAMGITNIDDKIINKSKATGKAWKDIADKYEYEFFSDMSKLNIRTPKSVIRVSDTIPDIIEFIKVLMDKQIAYVGQNGVYFDTQSPKYKYYKLVPTTSDEDVQSRIEPDQGKRHPRDFALWKFTQDADANWDSPWGKGRPGWHVECSSNCNLLFGKTLDIHSGGIDLVFPHHCNEIAQSEAYNGSTNWCNCMVHIGHMYLFTGYLISSFIQGRKMSKSLKNFVTINQLLQKYQSNDFRMFCLLNHYSSRIEYDDIVLTKAQKQWSTLITNLNIIQTELKKQGMQSEQKRETVRLWLHHYDELKMNIQQALLDNMNTVKMMSLVQEETQWMTKSIIENKHNVPNMIANEMMKWIKTLLENVGFVFDNESVIQGQIDNNVITTMCEFRKDIRECCLTGLKTKKEGIMLCKDILQKCDDIRQTVSDKHHCAIIDGKDDLLWIAGELPKKEVNVKPSTAKYHLTPDCPPENMFKITGEYSQYDATGFPTHDKNGKPLSATKIKKLKKQYNTHTIIHQKWLAQKSK